MKQDDLVKLLYEAMDDIIRFEQEYNATTDFKNPEIENETVLKLHKAIENINIFGVTK
jgi:hypothetical protein